MSGSTSFRTFQRSNDANTSKEIERTHDRLTSAERATQPGQSVLSTDGQGNSRPMLPAQLIREEPDQLKRIEELPAAARAFGYRDPVVTQELADFVDRRRKDAEYVDREKWIASRFALSQPEKAAWFRGIMPSFLERRKRFGEGKMAMQKQLFDITLYGPQTEEDIDFLFAIDTGKINLEELRRPAWEAPAAETTPQQYVAGMFARNSNLITSAARNPMQGTSNAPMIGTNMDGQLSNPANNTFQNLPNTLSGRPAQNGIVL